MTPPFRYYYQADLQKLALSIADLSVRLRFQLTVANNATLFRRTPDHQVVIKLYDPDDRNQIADLERETGLVCRAVDPPPSP